MLTIGCCIRVTQDAYHDEPLVAGMVGRVVADLYREVDPSREALVIMAGARKPVAVPLEAVEEISEDDYGDELPQGRDLWRQRRLLWKKRHGVLPPPAVRRRELPEDEEPPPEPPAFAIPVPEIVRRAQAVTNEELRSITSPALVTVLTEWALGGLEVLAETLPRFGRLTFARARRVRSEHLEPWLWDGVRVYLAVRTFRPQLGPVITESSRERVRSLFERIDVGDAARRLSEFCGDVIAVRDALTLMSSKRQSEARADFARGLKDGDQASERLAQFILQLHIVGFQAGYCADSVNHPAPMH